ncbi:MAG: PocR ligand-binding domain-containing protein [Veillonellales bacterium]
MKKSFEPSLQSIQPPALPVNTLSFSAGAAAMENIALPDLIPLKELQHLQDVYAETAGIASIITAVNGQPITRPSNFSKVCTMVRSTEIGARNCMHSGKILGAKARSLQKPTYHQCLSCGFIDASAPITVAGHHLANWIIGQINPAKVNKQQIREYAVKLSLNPDTLAAALEEMSSMPLEQFEKNLQLLWLLAKKLSTLAFNNWLLSRDNIMLSQAEKEIMKLNQNLETRVREAEAANAELEKTLARLQETQTQLIQHERLASLGGLVAGIAHEINTPVGTGVTAASYLEQETRATAKLFDSGKLKKSDLANYLAKSMDAAQILLLNLRRASELILSFKRVAVDQSSASRQLFNIKDCIDAVILSLRPNLKKVSHRIIVNCSDPLYVDSYPGAFSQIFTNLIMNSLIHAFPQKQQGTITIDIMLQKNELCLQYADDGQGIPQQHQEKIFEPFFTTRRGQGGTGLGLHIIYNIVTQQLKGEIHCQSGVNQGTCFRITLPIENGGTLQ